MRKKAENKELKSVDPVVVGKVELIALQSKLEEAISLHREGRLDAAVVLYNDILGVLPNNFDCLHLLGVAKYQVGEFAEAEKFITSALAEKNDSPQAYSNRGAARREQKKLSQALSDFDKALELDEGYTDARLNRGNVLLDLRDYQNAYEEFRRVLVASPDYADALHGLGVVLMAQTKYEEALPCFGRAIEIQPNNEKYLNSRGCCWLELGQKSRALMDFNRAVALKYDYVEALVNKANTLKDVGNISEAEACLKVALAEQPASSVAHLSLGLIYAERGEHASALNEFERAVEFDPESSIAHFSRANSLVALDRVPDGIDAYGQAIALKSDYAEAFNNRGIAFSKIMRGSDALRDYDQSIELKRDYAEAYVNYGNALKEVGEFEKAIGHYSRAVELKPTLAAAYFNRGLAFADTKKYEDALQDYDKALSLNPHYDYLLGLRLHTEMKICKWDRFEPTLVEIKKGIQEGRKVIVPFFLLGLVDDLEMQMEVAKQFGRAFFKQGIGHNERPRGGAGKARVAYYSADFYNHATSYLIAQLLEMHDRDRFEVYGFSFGPSKSDAMRQRVSAAFDKFIDVRDKSDFEIARLSQQIGIDIAVDLGGHTLNARTGAFGYRCAPVQVSYLGYPGTMGVEFIDYVLADEFVIPAESQRYYSEKVIYLPRCYQVSDQKRLQNYREFSRAQCGLPEGKVVFCCFNNPWKILPSVFESWMRILKSVDGSVLWLLEDTSEVSRNLSAAAKRHGVDPRRLIFASRVKTDEHLSRHRCADLFLDTFPYNAHTTANDALWSGVPVVSRHGNSFASRVASSLLTRVGLSELIAQSVCEYESIAINLALNPQRLQEIKVDLGNRRESSSLFDTAGFADDLENIYLRLLNRDLPLKNSSR